MRGIFQLPPNKEKKAVREENCMELMNYLEFETYVKENLKVLLPEAYQDSDVCIKEMRRPGYTYRGVGVKKMNDNYGIVVDLEQFYEAYRKNMPISKVMFSIASYVQTELPPIEVEGVMDYEWTRKRLFIRVMNRMWCRDYLKRVPHLVAEDLAVTPHIKMFETGDRLSSTPVTYELMERYGIRKKQLLRDAAENGMRLFPPRLKYLADVIGVDRDERVQRIITNDRGLNGAAALFYPGEMERTAAQMGGSFYAVPTSVHEFILEPADTDKSETQMMDALHETLRVFTNEDDWLSDHLYYYDAERHQFAAVYAEEKQNKLS